MKVVYAEVREIKTFLLNKRFKEKERKGETGRRASDSFNALLNKGSSSQEFSYQTSIECPNGHCQSLICLVSFLPHITFVSTLHHCSTSLGPKWLSLLQFLLFSFISLSLCYRSPRWKTMWKPSKYHFEFLTVLSNYIITWLDKGRTGRKQQ